MPLSSAKPQVLVVEDEALLLFSIADELKEAGFDVFEAVNADEAIRHLDAHRGIGLVFTDIDMPGSMDGLRLSAVIRDRWPPVKIIVTSGKLRPDARQLPAEGLFLSKPYTTSGVLAAVRSVLG
ncbi:MAG: response regulator [Hyphomicrobiales bacterium]|nr:MAG: response regulator [Hyphomicrobiales bacterium]